VHAQCALLLDTDKMMEANWCYFSVFVFLLPLSLQNFSADTMGVGSGGKGAVAWSIFKHGKNIADRGLKVLFFGLFCYFGPFSVAPSW